MEIAIGTGGETEQGGHGIEVVQQKGSPRRFPRRRARRARITGSMTNIIATSAPTPRIDTPEGLAWHLDALTELVPALAPMRAMAGTVLPRVNPRHFAGMAKVICGQQ